MKYFKHTSKKETCLIDNQTFEFNNVTHEIDTTNWEANDQKKLWQYNLHYFNYLNENNSNLKNKWHEELIISWCATCFSRKNDFGWDPYPTSLRSVNQISNKIFKSVLIKKKKLFSPIFQSYGLDIINS